jgi:hypothetical protein
VDSHNSIDCNLRSEWAPVMLAGGIVGGGPSQAPRLGCFEGFGPSQLSTSAILYLTFYTIQAAMIVASLSWPDHTKRKVHFP